MVKYYGSKPAEVRRRNGTAKRRGLGIAGWTRTAAAVAARPRLWPTALRQYRRSVPVAWWRHAPYLPAPSRRYLRFRFETAYGPDAVPRSVDVVEYLDWCREQNRRERVG